MLFQFLKKETKLQHFCDLHSHLLPIDDGVKDFSEALLIIKELENLGFKKLIVTPHINNRFTNTNKQVLESFNLLEQKIVEEKLSIQLEIASEYNYDEVFFETIKNNSLLSFSKEKYVLFEFHKHHKPLNLEHTIYNLRKLDYQPILAHPERYPFYNTLDEYQKLKEMGILFQINLLSLEKFYSKESYKKVKLLLDNGLVDFLGSDIHNSSKYLEVFKKSLTSKNYQKIFQTNTIKNNYL